MNGQGGDMERSKVWGRTEVSTDEDTPIPRHEFSTANELHLFPLDMCEITCPDCEVTYYPDNLGQALDWALGHDCQPGY